MEQFCHLHAGAVTSAPLIQAPVLASAQSHRRTTAPLCPNTPRTPIRVDRHQKVTTSGLSQSASMAIVAQDSNTRTAGSSQGPPMAPQGEV